MSIAKAAALRGKIPFHLERSHPTEAVYLRVKRGGHWFGLRIAAHAPAYDCSADFAQLPLPDIDVAENWIQEAKLLVEAFVQSGGEVVADPSEIQGEIERAFLERASECLRLPSTSAICAIRHRLNFRARWTFDEEQAFLQNPERPHHESDPG